MRPIYGDIKAGRLITMAKMAISLEEADIDEIKVIVIDEDGEGALKFIKKKILSQIIRQEKRRLDVQGKSHL
jgi:hypothetical protein